MNRILPSSLAALALVFAGSAFAGEAPKPKAPEMAPFEVAQPYPNSWYGRFGVTNCSWIDTGDGVLVIDTGATAADAKNLKAEIARTTKNKPIKWIAMTHLHSDSNDGFATFLPTDATLFVNARATGVLAGSIGQGKDEGSARHRDQRPHRARGRQAGFRDRRARGKRAHRVRPLRLRRFDAHGLRRRSRDDGPLPDALGPRLRHQGLARRPRALRLARRPGSRADARKSHRRARRPRSKRPAAISRRCSRSSSKRRSRTPRRPVSPESCPPRSWPTTARAS